MPAGMNTARPWRSRSIPKTASQPQPSPTPSLSSEREGQTSWAVGAKVPRQAPPHGSLPREAERRNSSTLRPGAAPVCKTSLDGAVVWWRGLLPSDPNYSATVEYQPTDVGCRARWRHLRGEGYGKSWIPPIRPRGALYVRSFGGPPAAEPGAPACSATTRAARRHTRTDPGTARGASRSRAISTSADQGKRPNQVFSLGGETNDLSRRASPSATTASGERGIPVDRGSAGPSNNSR